MFGNNYTTGTYTFPYPQNPNYGQVGNQNNHNILQTIQSAQPPTMVQCYSVGAKSEIDGIHPQLNVMYVGFNKTANEIYTKQLNNNGLIDSYTYSLTSNEKLEQKDGIQNIAECLERIENKLDKGLINEQYSFTTNYAGSSTENTSEQPGFWNVPADDARENRRTTNPNTYEPSQVKRNSRYQTL
jgi:hypothetical protein